MPRSVRRPAPGRVLGAVATALTPLALLFGLVLAPPEVVQGQAQRLMYVHVPSAWTAYAAFAVVSAASAWVLVRRSRRADAIARAAAELGVAMTALTIAEGSIWGHAAWGVWWAWDPRLVTTAFLLLAYIGYLALRALPAEESRARRRAAIAGLVLVVQVPVVHMSVLWWRTLHQPPTLLQPSLSPPIAPMMLVALLLALAASTAAGAWFVVRRAATLERAASTEMQMVGPVPGRTRTLERA